MKQRRTPLRTKQDSLLAAYGRIVLGTAKPAHHRKHKKLNKSLRKKFG